jgi:hypothetical protein
VNFIRVKSYRYIVFFLLSFFITSCTPSPTKPDLANANEKTLTTEYDLCDQPQDLVIFDLQAASVMQILIGENELGLLGEVGAADLANELLTLDETFCGLDVPAELLEVLDEIQILIDSSRDTEVEQMLDDLLIEIESGEFSTAVIYKAAAPGLQQGGAKTRSTVRAYLSVAARAQYWGNDDKFDRFMDAAKDTYSEWAAEAIERASVEEALRIVAEAQLLGIEDLDEEALERARDLAELDLAGELDLFEPCSASKEDAGKLIDAAARAILLGAETDPYDFMYEINEWLDIQRRRKAGEEVPECDTWQVAMLIDITWDSGFHYITWEGQFKVKDDETLDGQGRGTLSTHTEFTCVNVMTGEKSPSTTDVSGTFDFMIQGKREGSPEDGVFMFLFPADVIFSGVDTCNDFEEITYLPAYVIEDISVSGGVENYDPATDQIYLAIPAVDGATEEFETIIGPLEVTVTYYGGAE